MLLYSSPSHCGGWTLKAYLSAAIISFASSDKTRDRRWRGWLKTRVIEEIRGIQSLLLGRDGKGQMVLIGGRYREKDGE